MRLNFLLETLRKNKPQKTRNETQRKLSYVMKHMQTLIEHQIIKNNKKQNRNWTKKSNLKIEVKKNFTFVCDTVWKKNLNESWGSSLVIITKPKTMKWRSTKRKILKPKVRLFHWKGATGSTQPTHANRLMFCYSIKRVKEVIYFGQASSSFQH